ncbi:nucleotidyltransferase family protein [Streptomonospora litoralis]|uniref:Nicotine blue oxidoreductase n=1 Tax=Streptomonospora litoralis TaxID=2498135 RepID=A0A4P6Q072_9ACTN|nr:nucleotidyltransferase family protein [Streptomonospora litoralis]QBI53865.1 Nicotine blue oxidoreductase [Streptomonospora litoralis]
MTTREQSDAGASDTPIAGMLLAAGQGSRLGRPKALVEVAGERLADRGARMLREGGCAPVYIVTGAAEVDVERAAAVHNPDWETGLGSSLRVGLEAMPGDVDAVVVALADQPFVSAAAVRRLLAAYGDGARAAVATYAGNLRNPVLLAREHWPSVHALAEGDVGARPFLRAYSHLVTTVPCDDVASPDDIDTPEDLMRLQTVLDGPAAPPSAD